MIFDTQNIAVISIANRAMTYECLIHIPKAARSGLLECVVKNIDVEDWLLPDGAR